LELAKKYGAKLLHTSTSEVYGDPAVHPQNEEYWGNVNPIGERACYDEGKRISETILIEYAKKYSLPIKISRIFNSYGKNMQTNDGRVISNFIVQALNNHDLTVYGTGSQTRSFCYVDDTIEGLIKLMGTPDFITGPVNIGNNHEYTIIDVAKMIIEKTNSKSKIIYKELPSDDPKIRRPDIKLANKILSWCPKISLDEGLDKTIEYFRGIL
jgi:UDP-glucuronate decarboxylase